MPVDNNRLSDEAWLDGLPVSIHLTRSLNDANCTSNR